MTNWYATRAALERNLKSGTADTYTAADEALMDAALESASRQIDQYCGQWFYPWTQTRIETAHRSGCLLLEQGLLSLTSLSTDTALDGTFATVWAATDYQLGPPNAPLQNPPRPYWRIERRPLGVYGFPCYQSGVQIAGIWGTYDVHATATSQLAEALDASEVGVDVDDGEEFEVGQTILVDSEQMFVRAIATDTLTVTRAVNGTTAATHADNSPIEVYSYPLIGQACLLQASRLLNRRMAPFGTVGGGEVGMMFLRARLDPDVEVLLAPYRQRGIV